MLAAGIVASVTEGGPRGSHASQSVANSSPSGLKPIHTPSHQYHVPTAVVTTSLTMYIGMDGQTFICSHAAL